METSPLHALQEEIKRLHAEVAELRASRERLVLAADADRRRIEHDLHTGVQQHLVALAVDLQLAAQAADTDPATTKALLEEMGRDVQHALEETAQLAQRIHPTLLGARGLAALLRAAAASAGVPASVEVATESTPPDLATTIYLCWLATLEHHGGEARATIIVREDEEALVFEVVGNAERSEAGFDWLRDRVEALGGRLTLGSEPGRGVRISGSLPLSRRG